MTLDEKTRGKCVRCGRRLSDPLSVRRGMGPVCWAASKGDVFERTLETTDEGRRRGMSMVIRYEGTVGGFRAHAFRELRKAAMAGLSLRDDAAKVQRMLRKAMVKDLTGQILSGRGSVA